MFARLNRRKKARWQAAPPKKNANAMPVFLPDSFNRNSSKNRHDHSHGLLSESSERRLLLALPLKPSNTALLEIWISHLETDRLSFSRLVLGLYLRMAHCRK